MSVYDGDTVTLESGIRVRLWGIDAPEIDQPYGEAARDYLEKQIKGQDITVYCHGYSYSRKVCRLILGGRDIHQDLIEVGLAYTSPWSVGIYQDTQELARSLKKGVWSLPEGGVRPWVWRKTLYGKNRTQQARVGASSKL